MLANLESRSHVTDGMSWGGNGAAQRSLVGGVRKAIARSFGRLRSHHLGARIPWSRRFFCARVDFQDGVLATGMPALQQEPDDRVVVAKIREVLEQRIGADRFGLWFADRVEFHWQADELMLKVDGEFALERLRGNYLRAVESAAAEVLKKIVTVRLQLAARDTAMLANAADIADANAAATVVGLQKEASSLAETLVRQRPPVEKSSSGSLHRPRPAMWSTAAKGPAPFADLLASTATTARHTRGIPSNHRQAPRAISSLTPPIDQRTVATAAAKSIRVTSAPAAKQSPAVDPNDRSQPAGAAEATGERLQRSASRGEPMTFGTFITAASNTLASTAAQLLTSDPPNAAPICFWGATGTGKTHLLSAIRHELRTRHRLSRVILLSAEDFTNDFLSCVRGTGLPAFRKRYRDVDALLVDNVQFLGGKSATLREMLYTVDAILSRRRPLVLAGDRQPMEIDGLSGELAGRMSSGLVCGINPMELQLRRELYRRHAEKSFIPWDDATIEMLAERTIGDGRVIQGISQLVSLLQRMYRRMPTMQEITAQAGDMLQRGPKVVALADVERAVCSAFGLSVGDLKSDSKSRNVSQPRILAMYLSRQHTTAAFAEIGRFYGDRNHSTVIAAHRRVEGWLKENKPVGGRGPKNMKAVDAIAAVENLLRIG
jgi:chromosomal replication initiator protein